MILSIPLPGTGKPLIKQGQKVDFDTPLFGEKIQKEIKIFISQKIDVSPKKIFQYLKKLVGESVTAGEVIAEKKSFMSGRRYKSEHSGVLKEVNHIDGSILIEVSTQDEMVTKSYFKGEVTELKKEEVLLKVGSGKEYEGKEMTSSFGGKVFYMEHSETLYEELVNGYIIVAETISGYGQIKLEALGAKGFVTLHQLLEHTDSPHALFKQIKEYKDAVKLKLPYCFVDNKTGKIVFYH
ncbi:hypothetical protein A2334_03835 [Candidatus Roizmanbacteria bacterium RIFOXYB2_FULL_38_10]|uniref:Uncharacterized protein n=1 Tax=Candidatus Roizmanbacteria bacterium RIFOXYD1_FULL_38_12 TaxID=1802093 RepID=A0A1F7L1T2_9BACT|nr:MAG: hypothetical protein A3K47_04885 [Candidatus Roizmanbacteria bacterium RIFOXYA2_FULL_38_14]OGK64084.1 MAG: hypothetical protein A3K27_04885 [Candidatus Roizmanbacteria bacterium RIFOXYA1_FULL_37_12]OGK65930.1 MAG: hypothetical protein A3K38_04885 [Candidatus Roizmanbacteria bacterium RIFOXYB1_FULL_40_23]OGK67348.1 MAG: hypothetical protein A2334_03835 [Candidatus Roizmanbacteria bacterium RIFOXYB2_FULL_38_10]OGK70335.1 MAG: hypothetical protein A3K21_04890 [Candidatus Roizmanbacteria ba